MRFQTTRTWTSFLLSLLLLPRVLAAGAVLGILPVLSSSHSSPGWADGPDGPSQLSALGTAASLEPLEALTVGQAGGLQVALTWCFPCQRPCLGHR